MTAAPTTGRQASAISQLAVKSLAAHLGRGPESARTSVSNDVITVILEDALTVPERRLVDIGRSELVLQTRRILQGAMRDPLVSGVESITGRTVRAYLGDVHLDPDLWSTVFVLAARRDGDA